MSWSFRRFFLLAFGVLDLIALLVEMYIVRTDLIYFFSYFTVLSNFFATGLLLYQAKKPKVKTAQFQWLRGATTLYICITGIVYWTMLRHQPLLPGYEWINLVLHGVTPLVVFIDWLWHQPKNHYTWKTSLQWLYFPLGYLFFSLVRGYFTGWYPYFFINPLKSSPEAIVHYVLIILVGAALLGLGLIAIAKRKFLSLFEGTGK